MRECFASQYFEIMTNSRELQWCWSTGCKYGLYTATYMYMYMAASLYQRDVAIAFLYGGRQLENHDINSFLFI